MSQDHSQEKLRKWNRICIVTIIISALVSFGVMTAMMLSAHNGTFLSEWPDFAIRIIAYVPWGVFCAASGVRIYIYSKLKRPESENNITKK